MKKASGFLAIWTMVLPACGWAQSLPAEGEWVRISRTNGTVVTGILSFASAEEVRLLDGSAEQDLLIPRGEIDRMERSLGRHRDFGKNFVMVLASTSVGIGALLAIAWSPCTQTGFLACYLHPTSRGEAFAWGLAGGAILGVPAGLIVGLAIKREKWAPVTLSGPGDATLSILPVLGTRIGVSGLHLIRWLVGLDGYHTCWRPLDKKREGNHGRRPMG